LITNATAVENIVLSMNISGMKEPNKRAFAYALLEKVGIDRETADRKVLKLSGGEQQRIGIARALAHNDSKCVIIVTHSKNVTSIADTVYAIKDGQMSEIEGKR